MTMLKEGRPTTPQAVAQEHMAPETATGNRALMLEEKLIFEIGSTDTTGVDFADAPKVASRLGSLARTDSIGLPGLSEQETVRHYTRLSRQNYAIDLGLFPLGSCTMKHNPRLNARSRGCPVSPTSTRCSRSRRCRARWRSSMNWPPGW